VPPCRFNGATAVEPWKCDPLEPGDVADYDFNGATAVEPWKCVAEAG